MSSRNSRTGKKSRKPGENQHILQPTPRLLLAGPLLADPQDEVLAGEEAMEEGLDAILLDPDDLPEELQFDPVPTRRRWSGLTDVKQRQFIAHLAASGSVSMAAKAIGLTTASLYTCRRKAGSQNFADAWDKAVAMGARRVLDTMMEHAIHGTPETLIHNGRVVLERRRYNARSQQWVVEQHLPEHCGIGLDVGNRPESSTPHSLRKLQQKWQNQRLARRNMMPVTEEEATKEILKRLSVLRQRMDAGELDHNPDMQKWRNAFVANHPEELAQDYVGDAAKQAAFEVLHGPQDWEAIASRKAEVAALVKEAAEAVTKALEECGEGSGAEP